MMAKKNTNKTKSKAFFPNSPTSVGSPRRDGFYKRTVRQRTPHKLCSLVLPQPLISRFDSSTTSTTRQQQTVTTSDNVSIDGYSTTVDNTSQTPTQIRHSSNMSAVSASVMSTTKSSAHNNLKLPQHLRVGISPCDPLIVFDGRFVLVGTSDGRRIAVYSVLDFNNDSGISDDVLASERRRQAEWVEEALVREEKKDFETSLDTEDDDDEEEDDEHEWNVRDRMHQRQRAKQNVEPILILTLPEKKNRNQSKSDDQTLNQVKSSSYDEESTLASASNNSTFSPPTIVSICATPSTGTSLLEQRDNGIKTEEQSALQINSNSVGPSFENILGHIAVLTGNGDVHIFEFLQSPGGEKDTKETSDGHSIVNSILSFNTGYLGATCICMHQVLTNNKQQIRLSVGHQCGILTTFQIYSDLSPVSTVESPKRQGHERRNTHSSPEAISRLTAQSNAASRVLFQRGSDGNKNIASNLESNEIVRTLSEPIESSQHALDSSFGHAKVSLCLEGAFNVPIKSLSSVGWGEVSENGALLVVGLEQRQREDPSNQVSMNGLGSSLQHHSLSPAISLEVINTTLAEEIYATMKSETESSSRKIIPLQDYSVWPASGKEVKDGWMRGGKRKGIDPRDKQFSGLQRTSVTQKICCFEGSDQCFVSACSDGTVSISHCNTLVEPWGVMNEDNQLMLFHRCIGLGTFDTSLSSNNDLTRRYVVCCLRGGTMYMVPVVEKDNTNNDTIMFTIPVDDGDDSLVRLVQSFTAGMAKVKRWKSSEDTETSKDVALVGWQGGIIDVYELRQWIVEKPEIPRQRGS